MYNLNLIECSNVTGGLSAGEAIGYIGGFVASTPFILGIIIFEPHSRQMANVMESLANNVVYAGGSAGKEIEQILTTYFYKDL